MTAWRCLTVRQWWAWAMAYGGEAGKHVENRGPGALHWKPGPVALHAAKEPDVRLRGRLTLQEVDGAPVWAEMAGPRDGPARNARYRSELELARLVNESRPGELRAIEVRSAILATSELVDVHRAGRRCCAPWGEDVYLHLPTVGGRERLSPATHLVFEDVRPVWPPIECAGRLGLWAPTPEVAAELDRVRAHG